MDNSQRSLQRGAPLKGLDAKLTMQMLEGRHGGLGDANCRALRAGDIPNSLKVVNHEKALEWLKGRPTMKTALTLKA